MIEEPWNSLEIAKLTASLLIPISIAAVGFWVQKILRQQEREWAVSETLIKKRLEKFEALSDDLNSIYVFIEDIGHWKEETPRTIIDKNAASID